MGKLFSLPKPKPNLSRNGFDKSRRDTFSVRLGELLPVFCEETVPDSYYEIKPSNYIQTLPLFTNSFTRLKQNLDFYFVPYTAIFSKFYQFYSGRKYQTQSNQRDGLNFVPCFNLGGLLNFLQKFDNLDKTTPDTGTTDIWKGFTEEDIFDIVAGTCKLLDMLGYGAYYSLFRHGHFGRVQEHTGQESYYYFRKFVNHTFEQYPNVFRLAAYQCVFNAYYRNRYWDTKDYCNAYNFDDLTNSTIYGSDLLSARDFNGGANQPWSGSPFGFFNNENPFILRYRGYKKDRFMGMFPFPQWGDVSVVNITDFSTDYTGNTSRTLFTSEGKIKQSGNNSTKYAATSSSGNVTSPFIAPGSGASDVSVNASFDVYALRKAELLQKWRETQLRAGNVTSDQMAAVFGKEPSFDRNMQPVFLGSYDAPIQISAVISTANTSSPQETGFDSYSNLGERAGKADSGIDVKDNPINFKCSDFGVIIGVMSIVPENEYNALMLDDANTYSVKEDFFNPYWENLGFREVGRYSLSNVDLDHDGESEGSLGPVLGSNADFNRILGYVPPYLGYKCAIDKVHGRFMSQWSNLYSYDTNAGNVETNSDSTYGDFYFYNSPRNDLQFGIRGQLVYPLMPRLFYINPSIMKPVFVDQDEQENFLVCQYCDVKAVQPMTELGLPRW